MNLKESKEGSTERFGGKKWKGENDVIIITKTEEKKAKTLLVL